MQVIKRQVIKRNGWMVDFDFTKIDNAIQKAAQSCGEGPILVKGSDFNFKNPISVEEIQDIVEKWLMKEHPNVAKAYILYRETHNQSRFIKDRIDFMNNYSQSNSNAATSSETDANANITIKNVANLENEVYKTTNRIIQRCRMKDKLSEKFPEVAKQYEEDLENHIIYAHDESSTPVPKQYCMAVSLYPLLVDGTSTMDGLQTTAPKGLDAFCGQIINLVFLLSSQCKGAVGLGEFFNFFDYACVQEFGEEYDLHDQEFADSKFNKRRKTISQRIEQAFQNIIYSWNQSAGNRGAQSPFTNINYFDKYYWKSLFENFVFPDGTKPEWRRVSYLQKKFMKWFNKERTKTLLTFPVESMCLLNDGEDYKDKEYRDFAAEMWAEGHSFFLYTSNNADSVASCCFSKDQKILWKSSTAGVQLTTFEEFEKLPYNSTKENIKFFHNGSWIKGKVITLPNRPLYEIITANNKKILVTDNHLNPTLSGDKKTTDLTTDDYLLFNTFTTHSIPENDEHLTYAQGFAVGAFLGDGSFGSESNQGIIYDINYSQNVDKVKDCIKYIDLANEYCGGQNKSYVATMYNNVYPVKITSKELAAFIIHWTNWQRGTYAYNKELNLDCLLQSEEFRKGILDGWYNTDGGNSNRCYTTSPKLAECMEILIASLGLQSIINVSDRTNEKVVIRGEEFNRNYPLYCVRWYTPGNHRKNKDVENTWKKKNNSIYFKIKSITPVSYTDPVYCIDTMNDEEPYFTLPNGIITHNCRLRNDVKLFSSTTGLTGIEVGSCNVITLNLNRIVQNWVRSWPTYTDHIDSEGKCAFPQSWTGHTGFQTELKDYLNEILTRVYKYHVVYKDILYDWENRGMMTASKAGYIHINRLYSTFGINGINEAAEFLGLEVSNNENYKNFCTNILSIISDFIKEHNSSKYMLNLELVPAEELGVKNYNWDKQDGYFVPTNRNLYNSYIYNAHDPNTSILDRFVLQGGEIAKAVSGGQAVHCNLDANLSKEQYLKLMKFAVEQGTNYFTFNVPNTSCDVCHKIYKQPLTVCPNCGSDHMTQWTRIIGYLRPLTAFSEARYKEAKKRIYSNGNKEV